MEGMEGADELGGVAGGEILPDSLHFPEIMGKDFVEQSGAFRGEDDAMSPAICGMGSTFQEMAAFQSVDQAGDVGSMHDEIPAQLGLGQAAWMISEEVQDVELTWAEVPAAKKHPTGLPDRLGGP